MSETDAIATPEGEPDPPVTIMPGLTGEDALADLHAKYHCEDGNMLRDDCGWDCAFWEIATFVAPPLIAAERAAHDRDGLRERLGQRHYAWFPDDGVPRECCVECGEAMPCHVLAALDATGESA